VPARRIFKRGDARVGDKSNPLARPNRAAPSVLSDLVFRPPTHSAKDRGKSRGAVLERERIALKTLNQLQARVAKGKATLKDLEVAAVEVLAKYKPDEDSEDGPLRLDDTEFRLARLQFTMAREGAREAVEGLWDGTHTLKQVEAALRTVYKVMAAGGSVPIRMTEKAIARKMEQLSSEWNRLKKERQSAGIKEDRILKELAEIAGDKKLSDRQKVSLRMDVRLSHAESAVSATQREVNVARQNSRQMENRVHHGVAGIKQAETALKAESGALRKLAQASNRRDLYLKVSDTIRAVIQDLDLREKRKQEAEQAKNERQKKAGIKKVLASGEVKRLKSLGIDSLCEWRLVLWSNFRGESWCVVKVNITRGGSVSVVHTTLHKLTEGLFGRDSRLFPLSSREGGRQDLERLRGAIHDGSPAGGFESDFARALFHQYFQLDPKRQIFIKSELEEIIKAFDNPVLAMELIPG
jgi:hypothetical protein